jgi:hypothetical protein
VCKCKGVHLQGPAHLHEEGELISFIEFREHHTLPWNVFRICESQSPDELRLTDKSLADLRREKRDLDGGAKCNLMTNSSFTGGCVK